MKTHRTSGIALVAGLALMAFGNTARGEQIHEAVRAGNLDKLKVLLAGNPEVVNDKDDRGRTPLFLAVVKGPGKGETWTKDKQGAQTEMVKLLLAYNVNSNSQNEALIRSAGRGPKEIVELLLASKADVHASDENGQTALHEAARSGRKEIVELLLVKKADINAKDTEGNTPLLKATQFGMGKDVAELLLTRGADVNATNNSGQVSLHEAVYWCNKDLVKLLLSNKANPNSKDYYGCTPVHKAADVAGVDCKEAVEIMKLLLVSKADIQAKDNNGLTPLHWAAGNSKDVTLLLLANKAKINDKDDCGWTPLAKAKYYSRDDIAKLLRQQGGRDFVAEINEAAQRGNVKQIKATLKDNPDMVFSTDKYGATPLHYAATKEVAECLLTSKAKINAKNHDGVTPLHMAVAKGNKEVAEFLRQHGGKE
jgi:ankyrin repeat protein